VTLRGLGGNASSRALVLLDGVPQADPFGGWIAFPALLPERLGGVRVTRGGGSGYQGPGALAGTIELQSIGPGDAPPLSVSAAYGSRDSAEAGAQVATNLGAGFVSLGANYARGDGFIPIVRRSRGRVDRAAPFEQASVAGRAVIEAGANTELQASISAFTDERDRGTAFSAIKSEGADASLRAVGRGRWGWSVLGYLQTRTLANDFVAIDAARTTATQSLNQYNTPATGLGGRIELSPPIGGGITLRMGGDVRRVAGKTEELFTFVAGAPTRRREAGGNSVTIGAFADASAELGNITLSAGGRVDHWKISNGSLVERPLVTGPAVTNAQFADRDGWEPTGRLGVAWRPTDIIGVRLAGYRGWRLPTLNELYRPFRAGADATAANAALSPERLVGVEAGVDLTPAPNLSVRATVYANRLDDAIANVTLGTGPGTFPGVGFVGAGGAFRQRLNLDSIIARGFELDASWRRGDWNLAASYARTDASVRASGLAASLNRLDPAQTARDSASASVGWRRDDAVPIGKALLIEARAENLANTEVQAAVSANGVVERAGPRTLWLGLNYRLR
jgi:outer membrane receptor protein involved in Fe transport